MKLVVRKTKISDRKTIVGDFPVFVLCLLIIISEIPLWSRTVPNAVFYGLFGIFVISTLSFYLKMDGGKKLLVLLILTYFLMLAAYKILGFSTAALSYYSTIVKSFVAVFAMIGIVDYLSTQQKKAIVLVIILSICFTLVDNIRIYFQYGSYRFSRLFQNERFTTNAINTTFVYALLLLGGMLYVYYRTTKKKMLGIGALVLAVATILFDILIAQRAIAMILALFMYPLLFIYSKRNNGARSVYIYVMLLLFILLLLYYDAILEGLSNLVGLRRISIRIDQIRALLSSGSVSEVGGSLAGRYKLIMQSVNTAFSSVFSFLFGVGDHRSSFDIIGNHSHFVDEFARYGLLGSMVWISMMSCMLTQMSKVSLKGTNQRLRSELTIIQITYILRGFLGSIFESTISIQMFILIPIVFSLLEEQDSVGNRLLEKQNSAYAGIHIWNRRPQSHS